MKKHLTRLLKGTWVYGTGRTIGLVISFLLLPVFTSYLTPKDYGIISILGFITFLVNPIFGLGFGVSLGLVYFDGGEVTRKHEATWTAFSILLASACLLASLGFIFSKEISYVAFQTSIYSHYIRLYVMVAALGILIPPLQQFLQFEERAKTFVILTLASSLITIGLNVVFVVFLSRGVEGWIIGTLLGALVTFILFFLVTISSTRFRVNLSVGKELLKHGYPMIPGFAFLFIMGSSGKYMLQLFRGLEEVGIYAIGYNMGNIMMLAAGAFKSAWYPFFQSFVNEKERAKALFGSVFTYYVFAFGTLSVLFFIFARPVTLIMTKQAFHESYKVIGMVALSQFLIGVSSIFLTGVYYAKKIYLASAAQFIASVAVLILNVLLIPAFGYIGAAAAMMLGFLFLAAVQEGINITKKLWMPRYEWGRVARFITLYVFVAALSFFLGARLPGMAYTAISPAIALVFLAFMWLILSRKEKDYLLGYVSKLKG